MLYNLPLNQVLPFLIKVDQGIINDAILSSQRNDMAIFIIGQFAVADRAFVLLKVLGNVSGGFVVVPKN